MGIELTPAGVVLRLRLPLAPLLVVLWRQPLAHPLAEPLFSLSLYQAVAPVQVRRLLMCDVDLYQRPAAGSRPAPLRGDAVRGKFILARVRSKEAGSPPAQEVRPARQQLGRPEPLSGLLRGPGERAQRAGQPRHARHRVRQPALVAALDQLRVRHLVRDDRFHFVLGQHRQQIVAHAQRAVTPSPAIASQPHPRAGVHLEHQPIRRRDLHSLGYPLHQGIEPRRLPPLQRHAVLRPLLQVQSLEDQRGQAHLRPDRAEHQARHAETEQPHERRHFDQQQRADQQQRQHTAQVEERCHRRRGQRQQRQRRSAERLLGPLLKNGGRRTIGHQTGSSRAVSRIIGGRRSRRQTGKQYSTQCGCAPRRQ